MAKLVCQCLNVTINCISSSYEPADARKFNFPSLVLRDPFFSEEIAEVTLDALGIVVAQNALLKSRQNGKLSISSCLCCKQDTHAVFENRERTFVNLSLLNDPNKIKSLLEATNYSKLFRLVLPISSNAPQHSFYELKQQSKGFQLDAVIQTIRQQATNYLCDQQKEMDERIRIYMEQQYAEYNSLQKRILEERQAVINLLFEEHSSKGFSQTGLPVALSNFPSPPTSPDNWDPPTAPDNWIKSNHENTPNDYSYERTENQKEVPKTLVKVSTSQLSSNIVKASNVRNTRSPMSYRQTHDTMFDMDGVDEDTAPFPLSDDEADTDDSTTDDMVQIRKISDPMQRQAYATSLPITVPLWSTFNRANLSDDSDKSSNPDPQQIAASIQALALSIRDDKDMFGDLPRRRLNTGDLVKSRPF